jgi:glycosyltransferase involved in cell wall biosynthesis
MDDHPAGPASAGPRTPPLSVVIPVRNGGRDFERCLRGLRVSTFAYYELIVVDDASADGSGDLAAAFGARVLRHEQARGPAASRNEGAQAATAPVVFFLDADVVLQPDALGKALARFEAEPDLAALFGSYDDRPSAPGLVSQFRNLLHHYVHQQGAFVAEARPAHTFWTGCGAIRRDAFFALGGFDPKLYRKPAIEDIELGYRLTRAGYRIALVRDIQATHLKRWTFGSMVRTDIFQRGVPWMILLLRSHVKETDLNVSRAQRASVAATGLALLAAAAAPWFPAALAIVLACLLLIVCLNIHFYQFLARCRGRLFALRAFPLHLTYFTCCGLSVALAMGLRLLLARQPEPVPVRLRRERADVPSFPRPKSMRRRPSRWTSR